MHPNSTLQWRCLNQKFPYLQTKQNKTCSTSIDSTNPILHYSKTTKFTIANQDSLLNILLPWIEYTTKPLTTDWTTVGEEEGADGVDPEWAEDILKARKRVRRAECAGNNKWVALKEEKEYENGLVEREEMKESLQQVVLVVWGLTNPDEQPKICMVLSIIWFTIRDFETKILRNRNRRQIGTHRTKRIQKQRVFHHRFLFRCYRFCFFPLRSGVPRLLGQFARVLFTLQEDYLTYPWWS